MNKLQHLFTNLDGERIYIGSRYEPTYERCVIACGGKCCRAGEEGIGIAGITITTQEMRVLKSFNKKVKVIQNKPGIFYMDFRENGGQCPFLKNNLCSIHEDRPDACRKFPLAHESKCLLCVKMDKNQILSEYTE